MKVLVMLPRNLDVADWRKRFAKGEVPGATPYEYHFAEEMGCRLEFSTATPTPSGGLGLVDRALRRLLGFDLRHAWRNRRRILAPDVDVIWTHAEAEHLAVRALARLLRRRLSPMISGSVWLIDSWSRHSGLRQNFYRWLIRDSEALIFHSPANARQARQLGLGKRIEVVLFGISPESFSLRPPRPRGGDRPVRLFALGNDRHRDWRTFAAAFAGKPEFEVRIGSRSFPGDRLASNITVSWMSQREVLENYEWADCVVVSLSDNLHASGCTTVMEAVALGVPVVVTNTGGIDAYFDDRHVHLVPCGDEQAQHDAVKRIAADPELACQRAASAQQRLVSAELTTRGFAARHVALSRDLLARREGGRAR